MKKPNKGRTTSVWMLIGVLIGDPSQIYLILSETLSITC